MDRDIVAEYVTELATRYMVEKDHPTVEHINTGDCYLFARDLIHMVGAGRAVWLETEDGSTYGHAVAFIDGMFYDSETPRGVENPDDLVSVRRWLLEEPGWTHRHNNLQIGREVESTYGCLVAPR